ncbi:MAG TPA: rod shape-determining protein MreC [Patescibacteria group bacterium]|nr:rod shape-determining protein MreC [Patescibacteria group bacterium]
MQRKESVWIALAFCFLLSIIIFFLGKTSLFSVLTGIVDAVLFPTEAIIYNIVIASTNTRYTSLMNDNLQLQIIKDKEIVNENAALRDQFQTTSLQSTVLMPATIIGMPSFLPGVAFPEKIIIDKGIFDAVHIGDPVVYRNALLGQIDKVSEHASSVLLTTNTSSSFTADTLHTNAMGVIKGLGNGQMILDNVVLSEALQKNDTVVTRGSQNTNRQGLPPGLVIGKIVSIERNPSSLFQKAELVNIVDVQKLHEVFILKE